MKLYKYQIKIFYYYINRNNNYIYNYIIINIKKFLKFGINRKLVLEYAKRRKLIKHIRYWIYSKHHVYEISPYYSLLSGMYYLTNIKKFD